MIKEIHVYDLDGTVICSQHRFRVLPETGKIDLAYWVANCKPKMVAKDKPLPLADQYKQHLIDPKVYVVIATARILAHADYKWIAENIGFPDKIVSRQGRNDRRKGADLKISGCKFLKNLKQFKNAQIHFWEDNLDYLKPFCDYFNAVPHLAFSKQGV